MRELLAVIDLAAQRLKERGKLPEDLAAEIRYLKRVGDIGGISAVYHDRLTQAIIDYWTSARRFQDAKGDYKRAIATAFLDAFDTGWVDGGGYLPPDELSNLWLSYRQDSEFGYADALWERIKQLRKDEPDYDYFTFATQRADGYTHSLIEVYNEAKVRGAGSKMLTFTGEDGLESCGDCQRYKGQRHRASTWVRWDAVPPNPRFECRGYQCQHYLEDDAGNPFTRQS